MWATGDLVLKTVLVLLAVMSAGTWYIFFMKFWEQSRMISQSRLVDRRFWSSNTLNEGIDKLPKTSVFRLVAESGVRASSGVASGLVNVNDWIGMSLNRQLEEANSRLQGGIAFLASVGSTAPFVGLFGTVWGILNALHRHRRCRSAFDRQGRGSGRTGADRNRHRPRASPSRPCCSITSWFAATRS